MSGIRSVDAGHSGGSAFRASAGSSRIWNSRGVVRNRGPWFGWVTERPSDEPRLSVLPSSLGGFLRHFLPGNLGNLLKRPGNGKAVPKEVKDCPSFSATCACLFPNGLPSNKCTGHCWAELFPFLQNGASEFQRNWWHCASTFDFAQPIRGCQGCASEQLWLPLASSF